jgi:energy-coupling factor transporter ATP-binding protein EcfA2
MDFYQILSRETKDKDLELYPDFVVKRSKDLMVQGRTFYAIWDEEKGFWSRDEYDVQRLVDADLDREADRIYSETGRRCKPKYLRSFNSNTWTQFKKYLFNLSDNCHRLDSTVIFADREVRKEDYASKTLPYALEENGDISAWDELVGTLYSVDERTKIEWAIGSIVAGDSKNIQKFFVFYGPAGSGKSTILNVIQKLFEGYTTTFDGKALGSSNSSFATEAFKNNPLVAIQHDGDLSKIDDNTRLNSIVSHEYMTMNEKYKPSYTSKAEALLFIGSNQPVKISDAKSGLIRRLLDVNPTGIHIPVRHYNTLLSRIDFELGAIAHHCLKVYLERGKNYYNDYRPMEMMLQTDIFFNYIEAYFHLFKSQDYTTLKQAYSLYKEFCADSGIDKPLPRYKMREELRNYFDDFKDRAYIDGEQVSSAYTGFNAEKFKVLKPNSDPAAFSLVMDEKESLFDKKFSKRPAQKANESGFPPLKWANVTTKLSDINTSELHFVKVPEKHIVIDFDLMDQNGHKALERNLEAASKWPPTYAELSKSGAGVHLHYTYTGDISELSSTYAEGIEVLVYTGDASLRRKLTRCNSVPIAKITTGLPLKEKKEKMLKAKTITSEKGLRDLIERNLRKEIHPGTKPSVDFIAKILEDAYESKLKYDVTDLRPRLYAFANNSTHQAGVCLKIVDTMKFQSEPDMDSDNVLEVTDDRMVFFDVEVYKNLFVICWKFKDDPVVVRMINPKPAEVDALFKLKLIGFYNRRYDNHILYAASMGYTNEQLFELSQNLIVENKPSAPFAAAYNLSYADIWDFSTIKQSLKKFEIDLGIHHMELNFSWEEPVDEQDWPKVVEYCVNDVNATEAVFEDRKSDFTARQILAELSGLAVNDTTQRHTAKIIFGDDKKPQKHFVYTDLRKEFPGYKFEAGKSYYKNEEPGEGGYVYSEPGMYNDVAVLDVVSMHPESIVILNLFGPYTEKYNDLKKARVAIKRGDYKTARTMMDGKLAPFLVGAEDDKVGQHGTDLAFALRIALNIVYGLTSAKFDNPFRDIRNVDNIVAKRGALFMIDLKEQLQEHGAQVVHIKTDSVKIPDASPEIMASVFTIGSFYKYEFEHEVTYDRLCLVNDAVYIARKGDEWTAVGSQFQHPYVFKSLFSGDELTFDDFCENRTVLQGSMYLDKEDHEDEEGLDYHRMRHLGRTGRFVPVLEEGGVLYRVKGDKYYAVTGTKGYRWIEAEVAKIMGDDLKIDKSYFEKLRNDALVTIEKFGSYKEFVA